MSNYKSSIIFIIFLLCITIIGCSQECKIAEENKAVVLAVSELLNNKEYDKLDQYIAADFKRHCQATPDIEISSLEDFINMAKGWDLAFPDSKMELIHVLAEDSLVAVYMIYTGTNEGPLGNIPPTGKVMESDTFGIFRLENGKIVELWVTWDNLAIFQQLGINPPPVVGSETP